MSGKYIFLIKKTSDFFSTYTTLNEHQYYCFILGILNSKAMEFYQKMISGCLYSQKYRYTTTNLNRWPIPCIDEKDAIRIVEYVDELINGNIGEFENAIDEIVYKAFDLTKEDIIKIESFIG